jgi:hypothetical protein
MRVHAGARGHTQTHTQSLGVAAQGSRHGRARGPPWRGTRRCSGAHTAALCVTHTDTLTHRHTHTQSLGVAAQGSRHGVAISG